MEMTKYEYFQTFINKFHKKNLRFYKYLNFKSIFGILNKFIHNLQKFKKFLKKIFIIPFFYKFK